MQNTTKKIDHYFFAAAAEKSNLLQIWMTKNKGFFLLLSLLLLWHMETNWYKNCSKKWLHSPRILFLFSQVQFFFDRGFIWRRDTLRWHKKLCFLFLCKKGIIDLPMVLIRYLFWCFSKETWQLSSWVELGITKKSLIKASSSFQRKYSIETKCKKKDSTNLKKVEQKIKRGKT